MVRIIPDSYTEYLSGKVIVPSSLPNIEGKMGSAGGGEIGKVYVVGDKQTAKTIFKSGELLKALEESFNAGASLIYAQRIGPATPSQIILNDSSGLPTLKLSSIEPGVYFNGIEVDVVDQGTSITLTILNTNTDEEVNFIGDNVSDLADGINANQSLVIAEAVGSALPAAMSPTFMSGGMDGENLTNGDYMNALTVFENHPEINWLHCVGADTLPLWTAITTHCDYMIRENLSERFALLDPPRFNPINPDKPTINEIQSYVETVTAMTDTFSNRNAVVIAGEGNFIDSDGNEYTNRLTATLSGIMASVPFQKSLIGERLSTVVGLTPEFNPAQITQFIQSKINFARLEPGVGLIVGHSLTLTPMGDTYNRIEKLRAIYYAGKQTRLAAFPHVGKPNDSAGEGLTLLEADLRMPLDLMVNNGQIDTYDIEVQSDAAMRALGEVVVNLSVNSMKAMEIILSKVTLD
ncbi:MAG: DUF2586 family protein [Fidelibacterota bacterium]